MKHRIFFIFYNILLLLLTPCVIIYLLVRLFKKKTFYSIKNRLGIIPASPLNKTVVWIHAVSVGEILSIQYLIAELKNKDPDIFCYVTTGTPTGKAMAIKHLNADCVSFVPFDFFWFIHNAFKKINPTVLLVIEAEIWPNLLLQAHFKNIPVYLINARISQRSEHKYKKLKFFFSPLLQTFKQIFTQSSDDRDKFITMGVAPERLTVMGNLKALNVIHKKQALSHHTPNQPQLIPGSQEPTLLVGSLHPGELDIYLTLYSKLKNNFPTLKLILAPRHFGWQDELVTKTQKVISKTFVWTKHIDNSIEDLKKNFDCILVCKLGELFTLYPHATLFFLGGTFVPVGGHNLLEPAVWGIPSLVGPHYFNCTSLVKELSAHGGITIVQNQEELLHQTNILLKNTELRQTNGVRMYNWLESQAQQVNLVTEKLITEITQKQDSNNPT
jgi:3-deoxy-D-manno-octulosonic-acid transferase